MRRSTRKHFKRILRRDTHFNGVSWKLIHQMNEEGYSIGRSLGEGKREPRYFNRKSEPIGMGMWCALGKRSKYKIVQQDIIRNLQASTVWLGMNHSIFEKEPMIFETMVFDISGRLFRSQGYQQRYTTEQEAMQGHKEAVKWIIDGCPKIEDPEKECFMDNFIDAMKEM